MPIPTVQVADALTQLQAQGVRVPDAATVAAYLAARPALIEPLLRLAADARRALPDAALSLELYRDPEEPSESLTLYARFEEYPKDILERIRRVRSRFREAAHHLTQQGEHLPLFTTDYQPPNCEDV